MEDGQQQLCRCLERVPKLRRSMMAAGKARENARLLRLMAHPTRLQILKLLSEGELCVCVLCRLLGRSQSNVSQHLSKLRDNGLIDGWQRGKFVYYRLRNKRVGAAVRELQRLI